MGIVSPSNHDLLVNTLGFGIPALVFFTLRMVNAIYVMGKFHKDDIAMIITIFFYLSLLVLINVSGRFATNLYPPEQATQILSDPQDVNNRIIGSKIVIALEQCMLASTWGVKICILMFIDRLVTLVRSLYIMVRVATVYVILGYIMIQVTYYGLVCRPFSQYWAMPVSNSECATYSIYSKVQMAFNISSDLWLIMIPLYMTWTCSLPLRRKAVLTLVFSLALFTIVAAILNKVYNFASPWTTIYQVWYIRESSVAVLVANIICCWQLLQKIFKLRSFDNSTPNIQAAPTFGVAGGNRQVTDPEMVTEGGTYMNKSWWDRRFAREGGMFSTFKSTFTGKTKNDKTANGDNSTIEEELGPRGRTRTARGSTIFIDPLRSHASERFSLGDEGHEALQFRSLNDLA